MNLDEDSLEAFMGNNVAKLLGIKPTKPPKTVEEAKARLSGKPAPAMA
jgi:hypothetical protein